MEGAWWNLCVSYEWSFVCPHGLLPEYHLAFWVSNRRSDYPEANHIFKQNAHIGIITDATPTGKSVLFNNVGYIFIMTTHLFGYLEIPNLIY